MNTLRGKCNKYNKKKILVSSLVFRVDWLMYLVEPGSHFFIIMPSKVILFLAIQWEKCRI